MKIRLALFALLAFASSALADSQTTRLNFTDDGAKSCAAASYSVYREGGVIKQCVNGVETTLGSGGGSPITVDLGDDGGDDTTDLSEIATTGTCGSAFTVVGDKLTMDCDEFPGSGGGITGTLTDGRVTLSSGTGTVTDDSALTFDRTNNRLSLTGATSAADDSAYMLQLSGTLPASPSGTGVRGVGFDITSAGSAAASQFAVRSQLLPGYTGNQATAAFHGLNDALGTGADLRLSTTDEGPDVNHAVAGTAGSTGSPGSGIKVGIRGIARRSTTANVGAYGKADNAVDGSNIGVLGNASASTEATGLKNVGVLGTLASSFPTENVSAAGYFDGGTLADETSLIAKFRGTMPSAPAAQAFGVLFDVTANGSASQTNEAVRVNYGAGYTGSSLSRAMSVIQSNSSTGATTGLNALGGFNGNVAISTTAFKGGTGAAGYSWGFIGEGRDSTGLNVGVHGKAADNEAGTNVGVLGNAANSTEGTDLINVAGAFTMRSALPAVNTSVALLADNGAVAAPIFNAYDNGTLVFSITDGGGITTTGGATGQSGTFTIRDGGGAADCNLVFVNGILDSSTC